ncbi:nitroreductase [Gottschalkia acidurici 9a]|uniref:Nitroreductase n=1 Tax=Gottschalkia acidurici (strain ATCC 7906 / DSM 604 / BCRC 14475 / CIP 104303 / KCTC 5404 / NCIMB 10678 / 9a) TaxID=1128398 RepID=K0B1C8_GOTA9|nr:nitroreductase family protein [Gottschalkia acidurici]AFS79304.1 nitroreductase [Gottschalkia acidurici 9a]
MDTIRAIRERRSIRKFQNKAVPRSEIEKILELATKAPSGKNRQPWKFVVLQNSKKDDLVNLMNLALKLHKERKVNVGSLESSIGSINQASAVILVFNPFSKSEEDYNHHRLLTDSQSIGAAVQTMILAAQDIELASLWICDIFYCDNEICSWLDREDELVAAVAIGYPDQYPHQRPRKSIEEITEWL